MLIPGAPLGVITEAVQALCGILLPMTTLFLLMLCNDREVLGPWANPLWLSALASVIVGVLVLLSLILTMSTIFPGIDVPTFALVGGVVLTVVLLLRVQPPALATRRRLGDDHRRVAGRAQGVLDDATAHAALSGALVQRTSSAHGRARQLHDRRPGAADRQVVQLASG